MAFSRNFFEGAGNLGRDANVGYTPSGTFRAFFTIAVNRVYKDKDGNKQEETTWIPCKFWGKSAEAVAPYLTKGKSVFVEGRLEGREETIGDQKRTSLEVNVRELTLLSDGAPRDGAPRAAKPQAEPAVDDDDVPF